jgi:hypothetical protein
MLKYITILLFSLIGSFSSIFSIPKVGDVCPIKTTSSQPTAELSLEPTYEKLSNEEILALLKALKNAPDSFEKYSQIVTLLQMLRSRGILQ